MATLMAVAGLVETREAELGRRGSVGVGTPGVESAQSGPIKNANSTCLIGKPLKRDLQALLQREVRFRQRRQLLRIVGGGRRRRGGRRSRLRRHSRYRRRRRHRRARRTAGRRQRDAGEWGTTAARADSGGIAGTRLLLRPLRLRRDLAVGSGAGARSRRHDGEALAPEAIAARAAAGDAARKRRCSVTRIAWHGRWPASSTCSTRR